MGKVCINADFYPVEKINPKVCCFVLFLSHRTLTNFVSNLAILFQH